MKNTFEYKTIPKKRKTINRRRYYLSHSRQFHFLKQLTLFYLMIKKMGEIIPEKRQGEN